jgi:hypothetical protein
MELLSDKIDALEPDFFRKPGVAGLATTGMMPPEQIQAVIEQCADNGQEVEIEFTEQQTKFGAQMQVFSVKPLPKKNP